MKNFFLILIIASSIIACKKEEPTQREPEVPGYFWEFNNNNGDTAFVYSTSGIAYTTVRWESIGDVSSITFDSVRINADSSITVNQKVQYNGTRSAIGTGIIGNNQLTFHFTLDGFQHVIFTGIKH
jgi:hypothetical protein